MAKIVTDTMVISVSKLVKDNEKDDLSLISNDVSEQIEVIVSEILGDPNLIVEILKD